MPRATLKLTLSFGFVGIPCGLYTATDPQKVSFRMIHTKCLSRLNQVYHCAKCEETVPRDDIGKGYEDGDTIIPFSVGDLETLDADQDKVLQITACVPFSTVDPLYFEKSYYLGPEKDKAAHKAYVLFTAALTESAFIAVGQLTMRGKEHIALVRAHHNRLILSTMFFADEVRDIQEIKAEAAILPAELALAHQLVTSLQAPAFNPAIYADHYRERVLAMIESKRTGTDPEAAETPKAAPITDLLAALRASLAA